MNGITRYDVAMGGEHGTATATIKQEVLSVRLKEYTIETDCFHLHDSASIAHVLESTGREAMHKLLDSLRPLVKVDTNYVSYEGIGRAVAKIHLPYVRDEVVEEYKEAAAMAQLSSRESLELAREFGANNCELRAKLTHLKSLWHVRLHTWFVSLWA